MCKRLACLVPFVLLGLVLASSASADLVAWWKFDGNFDDSSGNGHDGTAVGAPTFAAGQFGQAVVVNGSSDYINCGQNLTDTTLGDGGTLTGFSMTFWVNRAVAGDNKVCGDIDTSGWSGGGGIKAAIYNNRLEIDMRDSDQRYFSRDDATQPLGTTMTTNTWYHIAVVFDDAGDTMTIYLNGVVDRLMTVTQGMAASTHDFYIGTDTPNAGHYFNGMIDDMLLYDSALSQAEVLGIMAGRGPSAGTAGKPIPANEASDVLRDVVLNWTAGEFAATHDVYFGTVYEDVNDADTTNTLGVLVGPGQDANTYDVGRLDLGQTYYWRIDEVNAPPDSIIFKGGVWSFTVEPYSRPIPGANITATASSSALDTSPEKTIDGSGLNADDQHSMEDTDMWLSAPFAPQPTWIQYAFDKSYRLDTMIVWNSNQKMEPYVGFGARNVTVEYSTDANDWTVLGEFEFARAPGEDTYTANTTVGFAGAQAQYVRLTITSNWKELVQQYGLSEVRFLYVPLSASEPDPGDGATDVAPQTTLSWRPGRQAASHQVFLGTDPNDLSLADTVTEPSYQPDLNLEETYYWKVVEVNEVEDPASWESDVWSFSTSVALMVDDFESYTDDMEAEETIWQTWIDGITDPVYGGSVVGNAEAPFAEQDIVYNGAQSMNFYYENLVGVTHAEAERVFDTPQNWAKHGIQTLSLAFHGDPNNAGQMYLKINNTEVVYNGLAEDAKRTLWQPWNVDLASTGANLTNVTSIAVGVDGSSPLGALYFDDIALYPRAGELITPVDPGTTGLAAWYKFDGTFNDSAGANHATAVGDALIVDDPARGQVVSLDGIGDGVDVPLLAAGTNTLTIAMWVNSTVDTSGLDYASTFHGNGWAAGDLHWRYQYANVSGGINGVAGGGNLVGRSHVVPNQWNHVAVTVSETEFAFWLDGYKEVSLTLTEPATVILGEGLIGAWLGTDGVTMSRWFTGFIDDARFYNRALSQAELAWLAGRTVPFAKPF